MGYIEEDSEQEYLKGFEGENDLYRQLIVENQYTRLETVNRAYSMGSMDQDISLLEKNGVHIFHVGRCRCEGVG